MEIQGDPALRVTTAQRDLFSLCPAIQGPMLLLHKLLSVTFVCQAGTVCLALCTSVLQVCGSIIEKYKKSVFFFTFMSVYWHLGFYCPAGTGFDLRNCPEGTYGPDPGSWSVDQCRKCDGGHYCSSRNATAVSGSCQEGYYCSHGNISPQPRSHDPGTKQFLDAL